VDRIPSLAYETSGLTVIEAFARKTPVIAHNLGALPEAVEDSGGGLLFRTDEELLEALDRIAGSPALRAELGQKGYDGFRRWWSREPHMRLYLDFLDAAAKKKFGAIPW